MRTAIRQFPLGTDGFIQQWLTAGLFADLLMPDSPPSEDEETAGERWTFRFTRHRNVLVPGYRGREGTWWLAVCCLRTDREVRASLVIRAPQDSHLGTDNAGFHRISDTPVPIVLSPRSLLVVVAIPAASIPQVFSVQITGLREDAVEVIHRLDTIRPVRLGRAAGRNVWVEYNGQPCPTIWLEALNVTSQPVKLGVAVETDDGKVSVPGERFLQPCQAELFELPYPAELPVGRARLVVYANKTRTEQEITLSHTDYDWEVHIVPHLYCDALWWDTQANRVEHDERAVFRLMHRYLEAAADSEFSFVLSEVPLSRPYWNSFPARREHIVELARSGRLGIAGPMYNQPQTTLTGLESIVRNICYGTAFHLFQYQASSLGSALVPVFGHDPNLPQLLAQAGQHAVAYAFGPYRRGHTIPANRLNFPADHWWIAPDGSRILARLIQPSSHTISESLSRYATFEEAWWEVGELFQVASAYSTSHVQIWPLDARSFPSAPWLADLVRHWNREHISPKLRLSTTSHFFASLEQEAQSGRFSIPPVTRDLNPINNGAGVSYVDTKLATRLCEGLICDAEAVATLCSLATGYPYPDPYLDLAWRRMLFNAHYGALTGGFSDQVYLDLLGGWRQAYELGRDALQEALHALIAPRNDRLTVVNTLLWPRDDVVEVELPESLPETVRVSSDGVEVPAEVVTHAGHRILRFVARGVPGLGAKVFEVTPGKSLPASELVADPLAIENEFFRVEIDPLRGGGLVSLLDKRSGRELVQQGRVANDLVAHREYPELPGFGEGPWHICTTGEARHASREFPAEVNLEATATRLTLVVESDHVNCRREMRITLWAGLPRVDFETHISNYSGEDWLFKVHFPLAVPYGRPLYEVSGPVVARSYCLGDQDTKKLPWIQDSAANHYVDLTVPLRLTGTVGIGGDVLGRLSASVAEIVCPPDRPMDADSPISQLLLALSSVGVCATVTWPDFRRCGDIAWDTSLPDFRIVVGSSEENEFTRHVLAQAGAGCEGELTEWTQRHGWAVALLPGLKLGLPVEVPVIVILAEDLNAEAEAIEHVAAQVRQLGEIVGLVPSPLRAHMPATEPGVGGAALLNRGTPSYCCYPDGTLTMALMRSCTGWPSGHWVEGTARRCPDGSSFQLEHWAHRFEYALVTHLAHWRESALARQGLAFNRSLLAAWGEPSRLLANVDHVLAQPDNVVVIAFKPAGTAIGNPLDALSAEGRLVLRLQESTGRPTEAYLRLAWPISAAWKCNLLEQPEQELSIVDGNVLVPLGQFETATVLVELRDKSSLIHHAPAPTDQPQYARWWRYNTGDAPMGSMPVVVLFEADEPVVAEPGSEITSGVTIAAGYLAREAPVLLSMEGPEGWDLECAEYKTVLSPGGYEVRNIRVRIPHDASRGQYILRALLTPPFGPPIYDVLHVAVGEKPSALAEAAIEPAEVDIRRGTATVRVRIRNLSRSLLHGEAILLSPVEAWELYDKALRSFSAPAGQEQVLEYSLRSPFRPLQGWLWVLAKIMVAGQLFYTDTVRVDL